METLVFVAVGLATGLVSRYIVPNPKPLGLIRMMLLGVVGSVFGGAVMSTFTGGPEIVFTAVPNLIGAFVGALVAIFVVLSLSRQRRHV